MGTRLAHGSSAPLLQGSECSPRHPRSVPRHSFSALNPQQPQPPHSHHSRGGHRGTWRASPPRRTVRPTMARQTAMLTTWPRRSTAGLAGRARAHRPTAPPARRMRLRMRCPCPSRAAMRACQRLLCRGNPRWPALVGWPRGRFPACLAAAWTLHSQRARDSCGHHQQRDGSLLQRRCSCPMPPRLSEQNAISSPWWVQWSTQLMKT